MLCGGHGFLEFNLVKAQLKITVPRYIRFDLVLRVFELRARMCASAFRLLV